MRWFCTITYKIDRDGNLLKFIGDDIRAISWEEAEAIADTLGIVVDGELVERIEMSDDMSKEIKVIDYTNSN